MSNPTTHAELIGLAKDGDVSAPPNGTSGEIFEGTWCDECKKDKGHRESPDSDPGCLILIDEFMDEPTGRWRSVPKGEHKGRLVCLEFIDKDAPYRCDKTIDMFTKKEGK